MTNEKRLIDANAFKMFLEEVRQDYLEEETFSSDFAAKVIETVQDEYLANAPTVDAVEVVHGRWQWDVESHGDPMYGIDEDYGYRCSECKVWADEYGVDGDIYGEPPTHILHYCPNCGAKMDGDGNE